MLNLWSYFYKGNPQIINILEFKWKWKCRVFLWRINSSGTFLLYFVITSILLCVVLRMDWKRIDYRRIVPKGCRTHWHLWFFKVYDPLHKNLCCHYKSHLSYCNNQLSSFRPVFMAQLIANSDLNGTSCDTCKLRSESFFVTEYSIDYFSKHLFMGLFYEKLSI